MITPSKKVLSVLIVIAALVAAIIITFGRDKSSTAINYASNLVAGEKLSVPENPDWQSELGTIAPSKQTVEEAKGVAASEETSTDTISKTFMSNYLALKQNGSLDQASAQKLIDQTVDYIGNMDSQTTAVTKLNIVADNGTQSVSDYGENLGNILKKNKPAEPKNELEIMTQAMESKDPAKIKELDSIIVVYKKMANELMLMPVPKAFAKVHLDTTNKMMNMALALEEMGFVFSDPIRGLAAIQKYQESATVFIQAIQATVTFIKQSGVVYKQGSGGYYLIYGI